MNKMLMEKAAEMALMDAIEAGADGSGLVEYMQTDQYKSAVGCYFKMFSDEFNQA